jgi:hypothetical protein
MAMIDPVSFPIAVLGAVLGVITDHSKTGSYSFEIES